MFFQFKLIQVARASLEETREESETTHILQRKYLYLAVRTMCFFNNRHILKSIARQARQARHNGKGDGIIFSPTRWRYWSRMSSMPLSPLSFPLFSKPWVNNRRHNHQEAT